MVYDILIGAGILVLVLFIIFGVIYLCSKSTAGTVVVLISLFILFSYVYGRVFTTLYNEYKIRKQSEHRNIEGWGSANDESCSGDSSQACNKSKSEKIP
jgi:hypothetical protein